MVEYSIQITNQKGEFQEKIVSFSFSFSFLSNEIDE